MQSYIRAISVPQKAFQTASVWQSPKAKVPETFQLCPPPTASTTCVCLPEKGKVAVKMSKVVYVFSQQMLKPLDAILARCVGSRQAPSAVHLVSLMSTISS